MKNATEPGVCPSYRILVIDDNPAIHGDFRKLLCSTQAGNVELEEDEAIVLGGTAPAGPSRAVFEIDAAFQGQEGLVKVEASVASGRPYALAFVDVRMPPGWDGVETITHLWKASPELQVVLCTAYTDYSWEEMITLLGESDNLVVMKKPFDNIEALQLAHAMTKKWMLARQARMRLSELERLVAERTRDYEEANERLLGEIEEREAIAAALRKENEERETITEALRISEERFAKAFHSNPMPMAIQALTDHQYIDVNESFLQMTGYLWEDLLRPNQAQPQIYADPASQTWMLAELDANKSFRNYPCRLRTKAGQERETLVSMECFELGCKAHALIIVQNVTEIRSLENQLRQAQKMEAVGQLAAGIAHDFNNLLTVIQGHTSYLGESAGAAHPMAESIKEVALAAQRAAALTRQLLAFSRKQVMQPRAFDLNELIRDLNNMLTRLIGEHITSRYEFAAAPLPVFADAGSLEQVLVNLAVNARDAMDWGGELRVRTSSVVLDDDARARNSEARPGQYACVSVTDTGCGMSADTMERIFEPFFTTKDVGKGTGLGLASVYGILRQHQGWIEVQSQPNQGSTFTFFIPLTDRLLTATPLQPQTPHPKGETHNLKGRILVVEDERAVRSMTCSILKKHGYEVFPAEHGKEALELWQTHQGRFDLVLTDMVMPGGITGRELAGRFLAANPRVKILYSSGYSLDLSDVHAVGPENIIFLPKPYDIAQLTQMIRECLDDDRA